MRDVMSNSPVELSTAVAPDPEAVGTNLRVLSGADLGKQSRVQLIDWRDVPKDSVLLKRMGTDKGLTEPEAAALQGQLALYRENLCASGWNVPELYATRLAITPTGWQVWTYEQHIQGKDAASLLRSSGPRALGRFAITHVADALAAYAPASLQRRRLGDQDLTLLPHGIDLQPANVVIANEGATYLVDIFPPKPLDGQGNITTYNPKLDNVSPGALTIGCATREGAMLRFLRKAQGLWTGDQRVDEFIEDVDEILALSGLPDTERKCIVTDMDAGYPLLDAAYHTPD